jgi:arylsulfatase A-like enzyme
MASRESDKPNILFILSDDQGAWAMGCAGNDEIRTPNLDRLAQQGIRFDNFFCASPVCAPARASIQTGRIPSQHGVLDFLAMPHDRQGRPKPESPASGIQFLAGMPTFSEILADLGYAACLSGKWHLGDSLQPTCGFETWHPMPYGQSSYRDVPMVADGDYTVVENTYATDLFTDNALQFLEVQEGDRRPFCLSVHYTAPHRPWEREHHPEATWDDYYDNCPFQSTPGLDEPKPPGFQRYTFETPTNSDDGSVDEEKRKQHLAGYFASTEEMDRNVGRLLDWLEEKDLRSNTLVVFMSDNGMNMGHHGIYGKGNATWPQNLFDTSVKVPCLISRPGYVPENKVISDLLSQYDWLPTILDYTGIADRIPSGLPGRSFAPVLTGQSVKNRESVFVFDEYGPVRMIRSREWKLIWRYPAGAHELYNVAEDPDERVNLFNHPGYADRIRGLRDELEAWFAKYVIPAMDGSKLPVTGYGQRDLATQDNAFQHRARN